MQSKKLAGSKPGPATQRFLDIAEIREDTVILKDGTLRAVLLVSSINFALKGEEEQEAIIAGYVGFLNALEFPLQIVIHSRKLNIEDYLIRLVEAEKTQTNELLKAQIADYRSFVGELITLGEIMAKRFYVVVPYDPFTNKRKGFFARLQEVFQPASAVRLKEKQFQERKHDLDFRIDNVVSNLGSLSVQAVRLDTQSLIELYYGVYNPDVAETQKLADVGKIQVEM
ncbi:hypothetical protein A3F28_01280 [Candidatus Uhrbacteria bacterium RIFCSPHIGHO2_12_FULL_57_11]|uniref:TraC-like domain-containing protein n=2 Tax=Candidatus Uhriibacteriota TaxID=1752732 RepID=A0A1F7UID3_9BACT|nr:MAG: hypothetical protein A3D72_03890 [Candidatus Uhrbacteria bacterium RIFCSPHIGHO2_02_FULL_57_19]OGL78056.1 MAG: hypothetical protein A3F28_01280 [Candidatus Uhrbacteria bacterium RIFCSPHIGHO2_12_FULL_57_11]